ncbi:hypothetical protein PG993_011846 [Apiospora rasikravindrae]|uniref:Chromosome segregation in meiosis protein n=1 Tax=Apiospora rasikravindrae TaxID=990691 RepID=A0ABR1S285_9PEZI
MAATKSNRPTVDDDLDNFDVDDFADPGKADPQSKKRKDASGLGIEEEVNVAKKQRVPNVKLDTPRLLSDKGIPKLRRKARELKFKGKGHEYSDTARLLSFYQLWLDDLFPKAKFLDALAMIEKTGHTKHMQMERLGWINEGKPRPHRDDDDEDEVPEIITDILGRDAAVLPARIAPIFQNGQSSERPTTPAVGDDLFGDEDIYDATPRGSKKTAAPAVDATGGEPDEEDLDALMAEEEAQRAAPSTSLFGNGGSLFGSGKAAAPKPPAARPAVPDDEDDLDALMAEAEAQSSKPLQPPAASKPSNTKPAPAADYEEDDLDALMAEAEAAEARPPPKSQPPPKAERSADADEEEAMAEMDGLW